jgi:hypothetical protein
VCRVHFEWIRCLLSRIGGVCASAITRAALFNARLIDKQNRYRRPISPNEIHGYCARTLLKYNAYLRYTRVHTAPRDTQNTYSIFKAAASAAAVQRAGSCAGEVV